MLARAKVNLCLHITGQRADGLHLLDSIVVFPEVGDVITATPAETLSLTIDGPFGDNLSSGTGNLITQAARLLSDKGAALTLQKNLPLASGIGGGSSDAAATIRLLTDMWGLARPDITALAKLGADVPVCMDQRPVRMQGIGEVLIPLQSLPDFWVVLVNSGQGVETGPVFGAMEHRNNPEISNIPPNFSTLEMFIDFLAAQRNDMQAAATKICPVIADVLTAISTTNCPLARMSGSGGTCFGLYENADAAQNAATAIKDLHPEWWVVAAKG